MTHKSCHHARGALAETGKTREESSHSRLGPKLKQSSKKKISSTVQHHAEHTQRRFVAQRKKMLECLGRRIDVCFRHHNQIILKETKCIESSSFPLSLSVVCLRGGESKREKIEGGSTVGRWRSVFIIVGDEMIRWMIVVREKKNRERIVDRVWRPHTITSEASTPPHPREERWEKKMRKASWNRLNCESPHNYCMCLFSALSHSLSHSLALSLTFPLSPLLLFSAYATNDEEWRCCVKQKSHEEDEKRRRNRGWRMMWREERVKRGGETMTTT